jgi:hypothetical protein
VLEIVGVVDLTRITELRLSIAVVGGTWICFTAEADVVFPIVFDTVFGLAVSLVAVFDFPAQFVGSCWA